MPLRCRRQVQRSPRCKGGRSLFVKFLCFLSLSLRVNSRCCFSSLSVCVCHAQIVQRFWADYDDWWIGRWGRTRLIWPCHRCQTSFSLLLLSKKISVLREQLPIVRLLSVSVCVCGRDDESVRPSVIKISKVRVEKSLILALRVEPIWSKELLYLFVVPENVAVLVIGSIILLSTSQSRQRVLVLT